MDHAADTIGALAYCQSVTCFELRDAKMNGFPGFLPGSIVFIIARCCDIVRVTRIVTIADSYDAMTSRRNYRRNLSEVEAVEELRRCSGTQFDAELVEVFAGAVFDQKIAAVQ